MKVLRQRVCDVCEGDENVCRYRITKLEGHGQHTVTVDLCGLHGGLVEDAMGSAPVTRRGRKTAKPVVSLDQIAAKKAPARKRAATKKVAAPRKGD